MSLGKVCAEHREKAWPVHLLNIQNAIALRVSAAEAQLSTSGKAQMSTSGSCNDETLTPSEVTHCSCRVAASYRAEEKG